MYVRVEQEQQRGQKTRTVKILVPLRPQGETSLPFKKTTTHIRSHETDKKTHKC